jgi:hypothetical protein
MLRQWQYFKSNFAEAKEGRHVMDTSSDQSDKPEAARVFKMLRELEFATLNDVRDLFRAANEKLVG